MKKLIVFVLLFGASMPGNILSMERARIHAQLILDESEDSDQPNLLTIDPRSPQFTIVMQELQRTATYNFYDHDALLRSLARTNILLTNSNISAPQNSLVFERISTLRTKLIERLSYFYPNNNDIDAASRRVNGEENNNAVPREGLAQPPVSLVLRLRDNRNNETGNSLQQLNPRTEPVADQLHDVQRHSSNLLRRVSSEENNNAVSRERLRVTSSLPHPWYYVPRNEIGNSLQQLNPRPAADQLHDAQRDSLSKNLFGQITWLFSILRVLGDYTGSYGNFFSRSIEEAYEFHYQSRYSTGLRALGQIALFAGGQVYFSRNSSFRNRIIQPILPVALFVLINLIRELNGNSFHTAMFRLSEFIGTGPVVLKSNIHGLTAVTSMFGAICIIMGYQYYEYLKTLFAQRKDRSKKDDK